MELTARELARQLNVTHRRAIEIIRAGDVDAHRTSSGAWLVGGASVERYRRIHHGARGLTPAAAWAALFILDGRKARWVSASTLARLRRRLRTTTADELARDVAKRSRAHRYRAANPQRAADGLFLTGRAAIGQLRTDLLPDGRAVDGYVPSGTVDDWARTHFMAVAADGKDILRENTLPDHVDAAVADDMPAAVVAADLAQSDDARERRSGLDALAGMLDAWRSRNV